MSLLATATIANFPGFPFDRNGQFIVSTARYLAAIDKEKYSDSISKLLDAKYDQKPMLQFHL